MTRNSIKEFFGALAIGLMFVGLLFFAFLDKESQLLIVGIITTIAVVARCIYGAYITARVNKHRKAAKAYHESERRRYAAARAATTVI